MPVSNARRSSSFRILAAKAVFALALVICQGATLASAAQSYRDILPSKNTIERIPLSWVVPTSPESVTALKGVTADQFACALGGLLNAFGQDEIYLRTGGERDYVPNDPLAYPDVYLPISLTADEMKALPSWTDWNRVSTMVGFFPRLRGGGAVRGFIAVQLFSSRTAYLAYAPSATNTYDLTQPPVRLVLTRNEIVRHWAQLPRKRLWSALPGVLDWLRPEEDRWCGIIVGFSPQGFSLGETSLAKGSVDTFAYYLGTGYIVNPYATVTAGLMTTDGRAYKVGVGLTLDFGIISEIFH